MTRGAHEAEQNISGAIGSAIDKQRHQDWDSYSFAWHKIEDGGSCIAALDCISPNVNPYRLYWSGVAVVGIVMPMVAVLLKKIVPRVSVAK